MLGPFQEWPSFRGYGSTFLGRSEFRRMGGFLGPPKFQRMGRFRGRGVSVDAAFLSRDWHFTINAAKHIMGD